MKIFKKIIAMLMLATTACSDEPQTERLDFVGDSLIARWDLPAFFPSRQVYNYGLSGAGLPYIESLAGDFAGCNVVVMVGTNHNQEFADPGARERLAVRYIAAINGLGAERLYLYSLLPRCFKGDYPTINADIEAFNELIRAEVSADPRIVYLDVYNDFMLNGKPNPQLYNDGLHLSPYGYEILTEKLLEAL